mgnify:CR=1 FL=1
MMCFGTFPKQISFEALSDKVWQRNLPIAVRAIPHVGNRIVYKFVAGNVFFTYWTCDSAFQFVFTDGCDGVDLFCLAASCFSVNDGNQRSPAQHQQQRHLSGRKNGSA